MQRSNARATGINHTAGISCDLRRLTALTKQLLRGSLKRFDAANGEKLGRWTPGFPELEVQTNSTLSGPEVQCHLLFMSRGLKEILVDQMNNLNPDDTNLHKDFRGSIYNTNMLRGCLRDFLGENCSMPLPPPEMPTHVFETKQWAHTLLGAATNYLDWLEQQILALFSNLKEKKELTDKNLVLSGS